MSVEEWKNWVRSFYREVDGLWQANRRFTDVDIGKYAIFYSTPWMNPRFMLIGENPGGGVHSGPYQTAIESGGLEKMLSGEYVHDYVSIEGSENDYQVAKLMRAIFDSVGLSEELELSVKLNLNFFRSGTRAKFECLADAATREVFKRESKRLALEAIAILRPRVVLTEGWRAFDEIAVVAGPSKAVHLAYRTACGKSKKRLIQIQQHSEFILVGTAHSASRPRFRVSDTEGSDFLRAVEFLKQRLLPIL